MKTGTPKRSSIIFLQVAIVLIGSGTLAWMLWEPHLEGVNAQATLFRIYFKDPFLAYVYIASVPFFVALYQTFKLLGRIGQNAVFSQRSVSALRTIKYCAMALVILVAGAEAYFLIMQHDQDDVAGGVAVGLLLMLASVVVATTAAVLEKLLQSAIRIKAKRRISSNVENFT